MSQSRCSHFLSVRLDSLEATRRVSISQPPSTPAPTPTEDPKIEGEKDEIDQPKDEDVSEYAKWMEKDDKKSESSQMRFSQIPCIGLRVVYPIN